MTNSAVTITGRAARPMEPAAPTRFPWVPILVLGFAWFLAVAIELSPAGLLGAIATDLNISTAAAGTLTTSYALGNAILVLPLTALALRFSRRSALNVVMAVFVASNVIVALAPTLCRSPRPDNPRTSQPERMLPAPSLTADCIRSGFRAFGAADLFVAGAQHDHIAGELDVVSFEREQRQQLHNAHAFHVQGAATIDVTVGDLA